MLELALDLALQTRVPLLVWGPPGVGKSAVIQAWATARGLRCWTVIASLREPADFGGLPVVGGGRGESSTCDDQALVRFAPPRFAAEAAREGGVIFLDELTTAPPAVQAALLRAVVDKAFGDLELDPERVAIVAAANPAEEAAGGWDLAAPLANRFLHFPFQLENSAWVESFPGYWGQPPVISFGGRQLRESAWSRWRATVAAFIRSRPALLLNLPAEAGRRGGAWPSPRTWDYASRLLAAWTSAGHAGSGAVAGALPLLAGCVGDGPAVELLTWLREADLPDPEHLLAAPHDYVHPARGDLAYAVLSSVSLAATQRLTPQRWSAAWEILATAADQGGADIAAAAVKQLARAGQGREELPLPVRELVPFVPMLQAAGMLR